MAQIGWSETDPVDTSSAGLGDDAIRSLKTSLRQGLAAEHTWPSAGGDAGIHLLGSARAYVGTQSAVSSSGTDGRLMWASDTSRLFHVGSGGTSLVGGPTVISAGSFPGTIPQRHYWAEEFGQSTTSSSGSVAITIPNSGYSGAPYIFLTSVALITGHNVHFQVVPVDGATFIVNSIAALSSAFASSQTFFWRSIGTRVL